MYFMMSTKWAPLRGVSEALLMQEATELLD